MWRAVNEVPPFRTLSITWTLSMLSLSYICQTEIRPVWYQIEVRSRWIQALIMKKKKRTYPDCTRSTRHRLAVKSPCQSHDQDDERPLDAHMAHYRSRYFWTIHRFSIAMTEICGFVGILLFSAKILAGKVFCVDCECRWIHYLIPSFELWHSSFFPFI